MDPEEYHAYFDKLHSKKADNELDYQKMHIGLSKMMTDGFKRSQRPSNQQPKKVSFTIR